MFKLQLRLACIILFLYLCICSQQNHSGSQELQTEASSGQQQIDEKRLSEINFIINSYFANCSLEEQQKLLYNCQMPTQNYADLLYAIFHKQHVTSFLKFYKADGRLSSDLQISQMYKIGQKVQNLVVSAYKQWIQIYKPNKKVSVEEMYKDIPDLDQQVLDVIEHYDQKYSDFIHVLKELYNVETEAVEYVVMGKSSEQQIAEDYSGILKVYFGDCEPLANCSMSPKAFVYFLKELSFYITPLTDSQKNKKTILVSEEMDFKATEFLIKEVEQIKEILGDKVDYSEIEDYSEEIAMKLFQHLKADRTEENPENLSGDNESTDNEASDQRSEL